MSREEKLAVIRGAHEPEAVFMGQAGWIRGVPRLGIPDLRFADGPPGVLVRHASTGMPATLAWLRPSAAARLPRTAPIIGRDARALGVDVILQPYINLYRDPTFERAYNTLGEDPVLTGTLAAQFVIAAQEQGVMAQAKHFVAYEGADDAIVDGQTCARCTWRRSRPSSMPASPRVMCSYNRINGTHSCGNEPDAQANPARRIQVSRLRHLGLGRDPWRGVHHARTGHGAAGQRARGVLCAAKEPDEQGMSQEEVDELVEIMTVGVPEEQRFPVARARRGRAATAVEESPSNLGEALASGSVVGADIDRAAGHVLGQIERFGWLDHAPRTHGRAAADRGECAHHPANYRARRRAPQE